MTHPVLHDESGDDGADDSWDGPDGVGDAHEDGGVLRRDVQVVDREARPREATATQRQGDADMGSVHLSRVCGLPGPGFENTNWKVFSPNIHRT